MFNAPERYQSERSQFDDMPGGEPVIVAAAPAMLEVLSMARRAPTKCPASCERRSNPACS